MEHVEPSVNKWKRKPDYTYASFGRVYGCIWGIAAGAVVGILMDNLFLYVVIGVVVGIIAGGLIGSKYINRKKKAEMEKDTPILEDGEIIEEVEERKISN